MTNDLVQGSTTGDVANATITAGVTQPVTPETQPMDASVDELAQLRIKYETDISRMKSTFQRKEAETLKETKRTQEIYERQMEEFRVSLMDEGQRKDYESGAAIRQLNKMQSDFTALEQEKIEAQSMLKAQQYFLVQGVPAEELVTEGGYDALWNSGMQWITSELQKMKNGKSAVSLKTKPEITAPDVVTSSATPAFSGTTWTDLKAKFGDEETVYRLIETGQLDASILPSK